MVQHHDDGGRRCHAHERANHHHGAGRYHGDDDIADNDIADNDHDATDDHHDDTVTAGGSAMDELGRELRRQVREAVRRAGLDGLNAAAAVNLDRNGRTTAVYSDDEATIVQRDGHTEVIRHRHDDGRH